MVSGLRINFHKTKIRGLDIEEVKFQILLKILNCSLMLIY